MKRLGALLLVFASIMPAAAQSSPGLKFIVIAGPELATTNPDGCEVHESPDAPARAVRLADGSVQLYATDQINQLVAGPNLLHLHQRCEVVYRGAGDDNPANFDDRSWLASPWTADGRAIWAIVHNEFQGHWRKPLCPTGRYMDCWYNALTLVVSTDGGRHFEHPASSYLIASLPYRYDEVGTGHHGYFSPSNIVERGGFIYMFAFATKASAQLEGNCLMRATSMTDATTWRGWDGEAFNVHFLNPYREHVQPESHVCAPVDAGALRWPMASLVRHEPTGLYIATMQGSDGIYAATSPDLTHWSTPARLLTTTSVQHWQCERVAPIAYPSILDPGSKDRNFATVGNSPYLFATQFDVDGCHRGQTRHLIRWRIEIIPAAPSHD